MPLFIGVPPKEMTLNALSSSGTQLSANGSKRRHLPPVADFLCSMLAPGGRSSAASSGLLRALARLHAQQAPQQVEADLDLARNVPLTPLRPRRGRAPSADEHGRRGASVGVDVRPHAEKYTDRARRTRAGSAPRAATRRGCRSAHAVDWPRP